MLAIMKDYEVLDNGLIRVHFLSPDPAPWTQSDFYVVLTSTEANVNQQTLRTTLTNKLQEKYGATILIEGQVASQSIASLNTFKNQQITVNT